MTYKKIAEYFTSKGKKISVAGVYKRLTVYYNLIGKTKPRSCNISDKELEEMKEQKKSDREIAEYFTKSGRKICLVSVNRRLTKHYKSKNQIKPKVSKYNTVIKKEITNEEIAVLRNEGMTLREIANYFLELGQKISHTAIAGRLKRISESQKMRTTEARENPKEQEDNDFKKSIKVNVIPTVSKEISENVKNDTNLNKER